MQPGADHDADGDQEQRRHHAEQGAEQRRQLGQHRCRGSCAQAKKIIVGRLTYEMADLCGAISTTPITTLHTANTDRQQRNNEFEMIRQQRTGLLHSTTTQTTLIGGILALAHISHIGFGILNA